MAANFYSIETSSIATGLLAAEPCSFVREQHADAVGSAALPLPWAGRELLAQEKKRKRGGHA